MSTTINDMPESAAAAVAEATRIATQAARNGTETAKASFEAASSLFDDTNTMGRDLMTHVDRADGAGHQGRIRCAEHRDRCRPGPVRPRLQGQSTGRRAVHRDRQANPEGDPRELADHRQDGRQGDRNHQALIRG